MGRCTIIIAPNGAGKSRELRKLSRGFNAKLKILSPHRHRRAGDFAFVPQAIDRPSISNRVSSLLEAPLVLGGLSLGEARHRSLEVLSRFGFDYLYDRHLSGLSGGEDQIVHLLAGIAQDRLGLIVDDPFGMLDRVRSCEVQTLLHQYVNEARDRSARELILSVPNSDQDLLNGLKSTINDVLNLQILQNKKYGESLDTLFLSLAEKCDGRTEDSTIECNNVDLAITQKRAVDRQLAKITCEMKLGRIYVLTGSNGCGKSLLLSALVGKLPKIARITSGHIALDGFRHNGRFGRFRNRSRFTQVGIFVPQHCNSLLTGMTPWAGVKTILENWNPALVSDAYKLLEGSILREDRPIIDSSVGQTRFITLVLAAMSVLMRPDLKWLITDEPDAYLDVLLQANLSRIFECLATTGKGVVITSHRKNLYLGATELPLTSSN